MYKLRELSLSDIKIINKWRNDKDLIFYLGAPFRYIDFEIDKKWYESYLLNRDTQVRCAIINEEDITIGIVSLTNIDFINRSAVLHIFIGEEKNRGSGAGHYAIIEMLKHAFLNLNLNRVELSVLSYNERAMSLYEKCGFTCEGIKRESLFKQGRYVDTKIYAILSNQFKSVK